MLNELWEPYKLLGKYVNDQVLKWILKELLAAATSIQKFSVFSLSNTQACLIFQMSQRHWIIFC